MTWKQLADDIRQEIKAYMANHQNWKFTIQCISSTIDHTDLSNHEKRLALESIIGDLMTMVDSLGTMLKSL